MGSLMNKLFRREEEEAKPEIRIGEVEINVMKYMLKMMLIPYSIFMLSFFFLPQILAPYFTNPSATMLFEMIILAFEIMIWFMFMYFDQYGKQAEASKYYNLVSHIWINERAYSGLMQFDNGMIREIGKIPKAEKDDGTTIRAKYVYIGVPKNAVEIYDESARDLVPMDYIVVATPDKWSRTFMVQPAQMLAYKDTIIQVPASHGDLEYRGHRFYADRYIAFFEITQSSWHSVKRSEKLGRINISPTDLQRLDEMVVNDQLFKQKLAYKDLLAITKAKLESGKDVAEIVNEVVKGQIKDTKDLEHFQIGAGGIKWKDIIMYSGLTALLVFGLYYLLLYFHII